MAAKYKSIIESYCESRGIEIPIGFARGTPCRYAAIETDCDPPKLVARTWFNMEDVVYFLRNLGESRQFRLLDFQEGVELVDDGGKRLKRAGAIEDT